MDATTRRPLALWKKLLALGISFSVGIGILEIAVRCLSDEGESLLVKDAVVGQRYLPGVCESRWVPEAGRKVELRFNHEGFRGPDIAVEKPAGVKRIAVLGDSFMAAVAVDEEKTFAQQLSRILVKTDGSRWESLNFGVSGNSTAQSLLIWRQFARKYRPDVAVLCFYNGNDLSDNSCKLSTAHRPYFRIAADGSLEAVALSEGRASISRWLSDHSHLYVWQKHKMRVMRDRLRAAGNYIPPGFQIMNSKPSPNVEDAWQVTDRLLAELAREVKADGSEFVLASIAAHEQLMDDRWEKLLAMAGAEAGNFDRDYPEKRLSEICEQNGIRLVTLKETFRRAGNPATLHFVTDGHWNERGNQLAAETIAKELERTAVVAGIPIPKK